MARGQKVANTLPNLLKTNDQRTAETKFITPEQKQVQYHFSGDSLRDKIAGKLKSRVDHEREVKQHEKQCANDPDANDSDEEDLYNVDLPGRKRLANSP